MNAEQKRLHEKKIVITGDDILVDGESFPVWVGEDIIVRKLDNADVSGHALYGVDVTMLVADVEVQRDTLSESQNEHVLELDDTHLNEPSRHDLGTLDLEVLVRVKGEITRQVMVGTLEVPIYAQEGSRRPDADPGIVEVPVGIDASGLSERIRALVEGRR